ncbi:hypothetical protein SAMN05661010_01137 [Modicisalibacter muralis]|uniref:YceI-like domain-containing protein n=1 Tax=Modicisalibacter muralis TaxID=119000 RepID=A0A1G9ICW6_9GAMM|nr:hypothetical protein [Halomonas muralis]SDL22885.1 hypothetical protein SAMN05661010_01137 [Halomonas muralis]
MNRLHIIPAWRRLATLAWVAGATLVLALPAQAAWQLDPSQSQVEATIIEITPSGPVPHEHQVRQLQGELSADGTLHLPLSLRQTDVIERLDELPPWLSSLADVTLATVVTQLPPSRLNNLAIGESLTETLMLNVQTNGENRQEPLKVRFTRESEDVIRIRNAERVALDGRELMNNQNVRSVLLLLGYEEIGDEVPVELDATLVDR